MVDYSPAGVAHIEQVYQQLACAQRCLNRNGAAFLENVGTANAARDMDLVRQALGDDQINYLGYSYGTQLGTACVERNYTDHVRAMVLDGAIDPASGRSRKTSTSRPGFRPRSTITRRIAPVRQTARWAPTRPNGSTACPTGRPAGYQTRPDVGSTRTELRRRGHGRHQRPYTPQFWKYLTSGLLGLRRHTDSGDLLMLADEYYDRNDDGHYDNSQDAFNAVRCVDAPSPKDPAAWVDADRRIRQIAPFLSYGQFTGYAPRDLCALWPVPATSAPAPAAPVAPGKVVVVSTTHDPATPYGPGSNWPANSAPR